MVHTNTPDFTSPHDVLDTISLEKLSEHIEYSQDPKYIPIFNTDNFLCKIKTLDEAKEISTLLSLLYPEPNNALLGIMELLINAIEHGNLSIGNKYKHELLQKGNWLQEIEKRLKLNENKNKFVSVHFQRTYNKITLKIKDMGTGFDTQTHKSIKLGDIQSLNGRGLLLAQTMAFDDMHHNETGNQVTAIINVHS